MRILICCFLLIIIPPVVGQDVKGGLTPSQKNLHTDYFILHQISISGNKQTRDKIILREVKAKPGDTIYPQHLSAFIHQCQENIFNTSLFNFVAVTPVIADSSSHFLDIEVTVIERWYIWPIPFFELSDRNFNTWWETKNLSRLSYGIDLEVSNVRGRNESLVIPLHLGYNEKIGFGYRFPYLNRKQTIGFGFGLFYTRNRQIAYQTNNNKQLYLFDKKHPPFQSWNVYAELKYRGDIYNTHTLRLTYTSSSFSDSLLMQNPDYSFSQDKHLNYFHLYYQFKSDHRDIHFYPLTGYYVDFEISQQGLDLFSPDKLKIMTLKMNARKFWKVSSRWYFAAGFTGKISPQTPQPYFLNKGLGYGREFARGYEYYVVDGNNFGLIKSNLKFALFPQRTILLPFLRNERFGKAFLAIYLNFFTDLAYVDNFSVASRKKNDLENQLLAGFGAGLDMVTYYDIVLRLDGSLNKMGKPGLYLHFIAPI
ncbi:MAG: hypothetical protein FJY10_08820 [Bacteroidetes bacterium]|nr:hypothetical protein [Bacteroidota bacterium]